MKKKLFKILILFITIILLFGTIQVFATAPYENPDFYAPKVENADNTSFKEKANKILGLISAIGTVCSVVIVSIIGLRYIVGSVEEKAEYKKTMLGYLIGAVLLFSATTLPDMIYKFVNPTYSLSRYKVTSEYKEDKKSKVFTYCAECDRPKDLCKDKNHELTYSKANTSYSCGHCKKELSQTERSNRMCDDCGKGDKYACSYCDDQLSNQEIKNNMCSNCQNGKNIN